MIQINEVDTSKERVRKDLFAYLKPHETQALFLLGNLQSHLQPSYVYIAKENNQTVGVCGYYPTFQSCTIFAESSAISKSFARVILNKHPSVIALLGMANMTKPAYDEFIAQGREPIIAPEKLFFELSMKNFKSFTSTDKSIHLITEQDVDSVARLHRLLDHLPIDSPITEEERVKVRAYLITFCLEIDGKIVAVASSNGLAIEAFQILGIATDPSFQRRGYAKAVCSHLIQYMQKQGAKKAVLFTDDENVAAKKCYLDLGFQITDRYYLGIFRPKCE